MDRKDLKSLSETFSELKKGLQSLKDSLTAATKRLSTEVDDISSDVRDTFKDGISSGLDSYAKDLKEGAKIYAQEFKEGFKIYAGEFREGIKVYNNRFKENSQKYKRDLQEYGNSLVKKVGNKGNEVIDSAKALYKKETADNGIIKTGIANINDKLTGIKQSIKGFFKRDKIQDQKDRILGLQKKRWSQIKEIAGKVTEWSIKTLGKVFDSNLLSNILKGLGLLALFIAPEAIAEAIKSVAEGFVKIAKLFQSEKFKEGLSIFTKFLGDIINFGLTSFEMLIEGIAGIARNIDLLWKGAFGKIDWGDFIKDIVRVAAGFTGLALIFKPLGTLMAGFKLLKFLIPKLTGLTGSLINFIKTKIQTLFPKLTNAIGSLINFIKTKLPQVNPSPTTTNPNTSTPSSRPSTTAPTPSTGNRVSPGANMPGNPRNARRGASTPTPRPGLGRGIRDIGRGLARPRNLAMIFASLFQNQLVDFMSGVYGAFGFGIQKWPDEKIKEVIARHEEVRQQNSELLGFEPDISDEHSMFIREAQRRGLEGYQAGGIVGDYDPLRKAMGGPITIPGSSFGDSVPMALPAGSFVLNRKASQYFQEGGLVNTILEPKEKVFLPGDPLMPKAMALNEMVPRFESGNRISQMTSMGLLPKFQAGGIVEHLHGDPSRAGYRADHGSQSNAHDHFAFSTPQLTRQVRDALASGQTPSGRRYQIGSENDGQHAPNSYHYTDQAFDIPWSQFGSGPITENDFAQSRQLASDVRGILSNLQATSPASVSQATTPSVTQVSTTSTTPKPPTYDADKSYNRGDLVTWTDGTIRQFDGMGWDLPQNIATSVNAPSGAPLIPTGEAGVPSNPFSGLGKFAEMFAVLTPLLSLGNSFINSLIGGAAMASSGDNTRSELTTDPGTTEPGATGSTTGETPNVNPAVAPSNAKSVYDYMRSIGLSEVHSKGLLANAIRESSLNPTAVGDNGTSFGLFQWHADRGKKMKSALGDNWSDWREQIKYALREPGEPGPQWRGMSFGSAHAAADWWMREWERPANPSRASVKHQSILAGLGFQKGGLVPTMLEPGEKVFPPGTWGADQIAMNNIIPRFGSNGLSINKSKKDIPPSGLQSGGVVATKPQPKYKVSPSTPSAEFSAATKASRMNGMYDMKSQPVVVTVPQPQVNVTGAATTTSSPPNLASSPRSAVASDYMFRNALSQAIHN